MDPKNPIDDALNGVPAELREAMRSALERTISRSVRTVSGPYESVRRQAAVRGAFDPSALISREARGVDPAGLLDQLLHDSMVIPQRGRRLWMMKDGARRKVLGRLSAEDIAREAARAAPEDEVAGLMKDLVSGRALPLERQSADQLLRTARVAEWLEGMNTAAPPVAQIREHLGFAQLLKPFDELLKDGFVGRTNELRRLRDYVGVHPPESLTGRSRRGLSSLARRVSGWRSHHPFLIHGAAGMGKSTLVAQFLREHAQLPRQLRFPFAYLDFDRASLIPRQPLTLLNEIASQLSFQFPSAARRLSRFAIQQREMIEELALEGRKFTQTANAPLASAFDESARDPRILSAAAHEIRESIRDLEDEGRPFLIVLDTFEEVQQALDSSVEDVLAVLRLISQDGDWEALRVVISGRAPLEGTKLADDLGLGQLDAAAAVQLLSKELGDLPKRKLNQIRQHVGGSPLALKLAAAIVHRELESGRGELDLASLLRTDRSLLARVLNLYDSERISVELYSRTLEHLQDEKLQKLAHPGFILRRITPDLIQHVLAKPCGLGELTRKDAEALHARLAAKVSLVRRDGEALVHRADVRAPMLALIRADLAKNRDRLFEHVNARAVAYYESAGTADSVEAMYHRLLGGDVAAADAAEWTDGIISGLRSARRDLTGGGATMLKAWLGVDIPPREVRELPPRTGVAYLRKVLPRYLGVGDADRAVALVTEVADWPAVRNELDLVRLRGTALFEYGDLDSAVEIFDAGYEHIRRGLSDEMYPFLLTRAEYLLRIGHPRAPQAFEAAFNGDPRRARREVEDVELWLGAAMAARRIGNASAARNFEERVTSAVQWSKRDLGQQALGLLRRLALNVSLELAPEYLQRYFSAAPVQSLNRRELQALKQLLRRFQYDRLRHLASAATELLRFGAVMTLDVQDQALLHDYLISTPLLSKLDVETLQFARTLLSTRHHEWRAPATFSLMRSGIDLSEPASELLDEEQQLAFARTTRKQRARLIVNAADDGGELAAFLNRHSVELLTQPALRQVAHAVTEWDAFLNQR
jgi:hypothetical protein